MESPKNEKASDATKADKNGNPTISQINPPLRKSIGSLNAGSVTVFANPSLLAFEAVAAAIVQAAAIGSHCAQIEFGRPIRVRTVCTQRHVSAQAWDLLLGDAALLADVKARSPVHLSNTANVSVLVAEGRELLRQKILLKKSDPPNEADLTVIDVPWPPSGREGVFDEYERLVDVIREAKVAAILVVSGCPDSISLRRAAAIDEFLEVKKCEPDADALLAFRVEAEICSMLWLSCPEPQMLSLLKTSNGLRWHQEVFVAEDAMSRQIIRMRRENMTLEEIGRKLGVDKSTIQRRLSKLGVIKPQPSD